MPMEVTVDDVRPWLDGYLRWEAKFALLTASLIAPAAVLVCILQYGLADGLVAIFLGRLLPAWLLHLAALGALGLLFVGSARLNPGYLNDLKFIAGQPSEEAVSTEGSEDAKPLAPGEAHPLVVVLTWVLFAGPELVRRAVCGVARYRRLRAMDREGLATALAFLASADKAVELGEIERAAPQVGPALAHRLTLVRGVLFIGQRGPAKVTLTPELRRTLRFGDSA
jgi:hypothetical protein